MQIIRVRLANEGGVPMVGLVFLQEEKERPELTPPISPPCEDTVRKCPSASQEEGFHQELNLLLPWPWTYWPAELLEIDVCFLSFSVHGPSQWYFSVIAWAETWTVLFRFKWLNLWFWGCFWLWSSYHLWPINNDIKSHSTSSYFCPHWII